MLPSAVLVASRVSAGRLRPNDNTDAPPSVSSNERPIVIAHADELHSAPSVSPFQQNRVITRSVVPAFNITDTDASPRELDAAQLSAEDLANLFPTVELRSDDGAAVVQAVVVQNFDVVQLIVARGLNDDDRDLNPDPGLNVPARIMERVIARQRDPLRSKPRSRKRAVDDAFVPRRSLRIAGRPPATPAVIDAEGFVGLKRRRVSTDASAFFAPAAVPWMLAHHVLTPSFARAKGADAAHRISAVPQSPTAGPATTPRRSRRAMRNSKKKKAKAHQARAAAARAESPAQTSSPPAFAPTDDMAPSTPPASSSPPPEHPRLLSTFHGVSDDAVFAAPSIPEFNFQYQPADFVRNSAGIHPFLARAPTLEPADSSRVPAREPVDLPHNKRGVKPHHSQAYYARRRDEYYQSLGTEAYCLVASPASPASVLIEATNRTRPGWRGFIPARRYQSIRTLWGTPRFVDLVRDLHIVPFGGANTFLCDMAGRGVVFRSTPIRDEALIESFASEALAFSRACPVSDGDRLANPRGDHSFCIAGVHRQYAKSARKTKFQMDNEAAIAHLFRPDGPANRITSYLTSILANRFPAIVARMRRNHQWHYERTKHDPEPLVPQFGLFWNFCINAPAPERGVPRVFCKPHADQMNCAVLLCALFVFWPKECVGEDEWSWLVIWELGVILQCPRGSFVLYPSALFFHFNIRIVKCPINETPTPANASDIPLDWKGGRGSSVWFTQASMHSMTDERDSKTGHYPDYDAMARKHFPLVVRTASDSSDSSTNYISEL